MSGNKGSKVLVCGIKDDVTEEDLELFFESRRYCPNGGDVGNVELQKHGRAVVTFCDNKVADRLDRSLKMPGGNLLLIQPYVDLENDGRLLTNDLVSISQEFSGSNWMKGSCSSWNSESDVCSTNCNMSSKICEQTSSKVVSEGNHNSKNLASIYHRGYHNSGLGNLGNSINFGSMEETLGSSSSICSSIINSSSSSSCNIGDVNIAFSNGYSRWTSKQRNSGTSMGNSLYSSTRKAFGNTSSFETGFSKSTRGDCYNTLTRDRAKSFDRTKIVDVDKEYLSEYLSETKQYDGTDELKSHSTSFKMSHHLPSSGCARNRKTEELNFRNEQFKLLKLVLDSEDNKFTKKCSFKFDEKNCSLIVEGTTDDLSDTKLSLHEVVSQATSDSMNISRQAQKLLLSPRGEKWLTAEFSQQNLMAVLYTIDGRATILARDESTLQSSCKILEKILVYQNIPFDDSMQSFLQSSTWAKKVEAVEDSRLISIDTDYSKKVIALTGCSNDVSNCVAELQGLLRMNSNTTRSIQLKIGIVRLLKSQTHEITTQINQILKSRVQIEFNLEHGVIKLTGLLDDVDVAAKLLDSNYVKAVCYDKFESNFPCLTLDMFKNKNDAGNDLIDLLELRHKCIIEVRGNSLRATYPPKDYRQDDSVEKKSSGMKNNQIQMIKGSIVKYKADVLVNTIANNRLDNAGVVAQSFLAAGGSQLYQVLRNSVPQDFGNDVVVTSAYGQLDAKFIFHAAIRRYCNQQSISRMYDLIKKCLEIATKRGASSIAFPTLGCGKLGYDPKTVVNCFKEAIQKTHSHLQISIIAFEDHLFHDFQSHLPYESSSHSSDSDTKETSSLFGKLKTYFGGFYPQRKFQVSNVIVFHINAMSDDIVRNVKETLAVKLKEMITEDPISDEVIAGLSDEMVSKIESLQSSDVCIKIDKPRKTITVNGVKSVADQVKMKVLHLIYKQNAEGGRTLRKDKFPSYWTHFKQDIKITSKTEHKRTELHSGSIFDEVSQLVMKTWDQQKVGHGSDAVGLGKHKIKICKIFAIENPALYRTYMAKRKEYHLNSSVGYKFHRVKGLKGEAEIMTMNLGLRKLEVMLDKEVNECFLLHGTKPDKHGSIESTGLDSRLSSQKVLFGTGTYFTESSTKADQYADSKNMRLPNGQLLYMYVCRVLLGNTFICQVPQPFKRPPCMKQGCFSDSCSEHGHVGQFDSVIGVNNVKGVRLLFREFVIYHPDLSYPEFLVEYVRQ